MTPKRSKASLLSTALLLLLLPTTQAWTFIWTDSKGSTTIEPPGNWDEVGHPCKEINHPKGAWYEFDAEDDRQITIYLYSSKDCSGGAKGYATNLKEGNSSVPLRSYEVIDEASSSSTSSFATSTSTSTSTETPTATGSTTPTPTPDDEGSGSSSGSDSDSISPGAIGGIVAGVVVGAGVIGAIIYLARQRRKESSGPEYNSASISNPRPGPGPGPGPSPSPQPPTRSPTAGSNMIAAPYVQNNHEPYSPTAIDAYAQQPLPYSPLDSAHPGGHGGHGGWPVKSPLYSPESAPGPPPGYMPHQHQHGHGQQFTAELDGGAELQELSSTHMVSEIDGRSRGTSVYYGDRKI